MPHGCGGNLFLAVSVGVLALLGLCGCEDAAKRPAQAKVPANAPPLTASAATAPTPKPQVSRPGSGQAAPKLPPLPKLPLRNPGAQRLLALAPQARSGKELLIARVEAKFAAGEQNYKAGHLEAARRDFDAAVDALLESGYDLSADPKLEALFEKIVDTTYGYELQAFRAGEGFNEVPAVPAPIEEVAEMTFPVDPRLKPKAEKSLESVSHDLPLTLNDTVLSFLNFFQTPRGRDIVETGLRRAGRYKETISRVLREEGMPQDLMYMAQAESAFQPQALSRKGARGLWQFMAWRANQYGLQHTWWIDERQDPEKSTRAAARHLRDLYGQFGDWYLAMAAYDCGPGNVQKGIERTGYADFWELHKRNVLPRETRNYVPIILALTLIAKDAAHYGIQVEPDQPLPYEAWKPGKPIDLRLVTDTIDTDLDTLRQLNPALLRMVTPNVPNFELRLPPGTAEKLTAGLADIPQEKWVSWRRHRVEAGDTLASIAKHYRVTMAAIAEVNKLDRKDPLEPGEKLIIPAAPPAELKSRLVRYRVRRGDTLLAIADRFSVEAEDLRRWNGLRSNHVYRGMVLRIYTPGGGPELRPARKRAGVSSKGRPKTAASAQAPKSASSSDPH